MKSNRISWIDNLKTFGVILVVFGHFSPNIFFSKIIYSFHMPLFFFLSGFLRKDRNFKSVLSTKSKSILLPYLILSIISFPFGILRDYAFNIEISWSERILQLFFWNGSVGWNSPLWFLLVLYLIEIIYALILNFTNRINIVLIMLLVIGYFMYINQIILPLGIHIVMWMLPIYIMGNKINNEKIISYRNKDQYIILIGLFLLILNIFISINSKNSISVYEMRLNNYFIFYLNALLGIFGLFIIFSYTKYNVFSEFIVKHSIFIVCTHYFHLYFFQICDKLLPSPIFFNQSIASSIFMTLFTFSTYIIFFYILENHFKNSLILKYF
ncbi:acyltransferase family protein [Globicatella sanguinis]|uniref:acyltransferase family protein n=1 Tax=Globicatella sanguinis TaxID=13076 RepID=UPI000824A9D9|nr:acyltransferase family protein [Globicatella sanguinis]